MAPIMDTQNQFIPSSVYSRPNYYVEHIQANAKAITDHYDQKNNWTNDRPFDRQGDRTHCPFPCDDEDDSTMVQDPTKPMRNHLRNITPLERRVIWQPRPYTVTYGGHPVKRRWLGDGTREEMTSLRILPSEGVKDLHDPPMPSQADPIFPNWYGGNTHLVNRPRRDYEFEYHKVALRHDAVDMQFPKLHWPKSPPAGNDHLGEMFTRHNYAKAPIFRSAYLNRVMDTSGNRGGPLHFYEMWPGYPKYGKMLYQL